MRAVCWVLMECLVSPGPGRDIRGVAKANNKGGIPRRPLNLDMSRVVYSLQVGTMDDTEILLFAHCRNALVTYVLLEKMSLRHMVVVVFSSIRRSTCNFSAVEPGLSMLQMFRCTKLIVRVVKHAKCAGSRQSIEIHSCCYSPATVPATLSGMVNHPCLL